MKIWRQIDGLELVCPAGGPAAVRAAVDAGAHSVYCGFRDATNARNFPGLNFSRAELGDAVAYAHARDVRVLVAINTFPTAGKPELWHGAIDDAARLGADAVILADIGLLAYASERHPNLRRHLSVQAAASTPDAIEFYVRAFDVKRVVLPRVLTVAEIRTLNDKVDVETEVFAFGGLCVMAEGRCSLSSYATGKSPNVHGVCSPASHVVYEERDGALNSRLGRFLINRFGPEEAAGYPTLCKGRFSTPEQSFYLFEEPTSLSAMSMLADLQAAGVTALKIEGRQRGRAYVAKVVSAFRRAVDAMAAGEAPPEIDFCTMTEGASDTAGAYVKRWR